MNSSISSFRTEVKVLVMVLCGLSAAELFIRIYEKNLSADVAHIRSIPDAAAEAGRQSRASTLFMGSSLVRYGVDIPTIKQQLEKHGIAPPPILKVNPDASSIGEWYYYLNTYFIQTGNIPKVLVLGFANNHLEDQRQIRAERLGAYCCNFCDTPEVFKQDVTEFSARVDFLLAMGSRCCADRDRVRKRILDEFVPDYRDSAARINDILRSRHPVQAVSAGATFTRFQRLLNLARANKIEVAVMAMPVQDSYTIQPAVIEMTRKAGGLFLDCRRIESLSPKSFLDDIHLNDEGARIFSETCSKMLAQWAPFAQGSVSAGTDRQRGTDLAQPLLSANIKR